MKRIFAVLAMLVCVIGGITGILLLGNDEGDDVSTKRYRTQPAEIMGLQK